MEEAAEADDEQSMVGTVPSFRPFPYRRVFRIRCISISNIVPPSSSIRLLSLHVTCKPDPSQLLHEQMKHILHITAGFEWGAPIFMFHCISDVSDLRISQTQLSFAQSK